MRHMLIILAALFLTASLAGAADLRCQGDLMTSGTIMSKVRTKCGQPLSEVRVGEKTTYSSNGDEQLLYITEMTYAANSGYYVLTFEGGVLKKTEYYQH